MDGWVVFDYKKEENGVEVVDSGFTLVSFNESQVQQQRPKETEVFAELASPPTSRSYPSLSTSVSFPSAPEKRKEEVVEEVRRAGGDAVEARIQALEEELARTKEQLQLAERRANEAEAGQIKAQERALVAERRLLQIAQKEALAKLQHPPVSHLLKNKRATKRAAVNTQLTMAQQLNGTSITKRQQWAKGNHRATCNTHRNV
jgi:hypothetical protein